MITHRQLAPVFIVQALLLLVAAWRNADQLNPDAVAYCRIAGYYANGQWELAMTGYWGPLLSWQMVPLLKMGCMPLTAARVVMVVSGVVFLAGAVAVFRAFRLPSKATLAGAWIASGWSVFWSVRNISPDLLLAGLAGLAMAATVTALLTSGSAPKEETQKMHGTAETGAGPENSIGAKNFCTLWTFSLMRQHLADRAQRHAISAGMWWGLAYLAKAVALPWAILLTVSLTLLAQRGGPESRRKLTAKLGVIWLCLGLVAGPWIATLSLHYGKFIFSTTGPIAHALAGPGDESRYHPAMVTLHQPDAGRVTQWEEPSRMAYRYWSPFASGENFQHQLRVAGQNLITILKWLAPWSEWLSSESLPTWRRWLGAVDFLGLGAVALLSVVFRCAFSQLRPLPRRWRMAILPVVLLGGMYLPFFVMPEDNRYFWPVWPCLWVLGLAALSRTGKVRQVGFQILLWSFALSSLAWCFAALRGLPNVTPAAAKMIAEQVKHNRWDGPVAGSGLLPGGRAGLYTAFHLGERWLGDDSLARPEDFAAAGARVVLLRRDSPQREEFLRAPGWRPFEPAASIPLIVFVREKL